MIIDKIINILPQINDKFEMLDRGGCGTFARILSELTGINNFGYVFDTREPDEDPPIHVLLKVENKYIDSTGLRTKEEILKNYNEFEKDNPFIFIDGDINMLEMHYDDLGNGLCTLDYKGREKEIKKFILDNIQKQKPLNETSVKSTEREKIYEDSTWLVVRPLTHLAARKYGCDTNWCTSTSAERFWDWHTKDNNFFIYIINKKTKPAALNIRNQKIKDYQDLYNKPEWDKVDDDEKEKRFLDFSRIAIDVEWEDDMPEIKMYDANDIELYDFHYHTIDDLIIPENIKDAVNKYIDKILSNAVKPEPSKEKQMALFEIRKQIRKQLNEVFSKEYVDEVTEEILNYTDAMEVGGWQTDDEEDDIENIKRYIRDEIFGKDWLSGGLNNMHSEIVLYRIIFINDSKDLKADFLGKHWVRSEQYAKTHIKDIMSQFHAANPGVKNIEDAYLIKAIFSSDAIDIISTVYNNLVFDHEEEITIKDDYKQKSFEITKL